MRLADIHCHILPYVDDGAEHVEEMEKLLRVDAEQGIQVVCATPHLRHGMFESTDEAVREQFKRAADFIGREELPITLCLGREYFCDAHFFERTKTGTIIPLGSGNTVLTEFSGGYTSETIVKYTKAVMEAGYAPLIAHVERYGSLDADGVSRLRDLGAMIQINAGSVLGREGLRRKRYVWGLMKRDLVDVVASDAHDPVYRPQELGTCAVKIENKLGQTYAQKVLWDVPLKILSLDEGETGVGIRRTEAE